MSHVTKRGAVKPTLNITPLIDVVFLLIVFFMIVNNIVTDQVPELQLPDLEDPETNMPEGESRIIVNIVPEQEFEPSDGGKPGPGFSEGQVLARGGQAKYVTVGTMKWEIGAEGAMDDFQEYVSKTIAQRLANDPQNPPKMLLRADAAIYYNQVLQVMTFYQQAMMDGGLDPKIAGQTSIHMVAYMPEE